MISIRNDVVLLFRELGEKFDSIFLVVLDGQQGAEPSQVFIVPHFVVLDCTLKVSEFLVFVFKVFLLLCDV